MSRSTASDGAWTPKEIIVDAFADALQQPFKAFLLLGAAPTLWVETISALANRAIGLRSGPAPTWAVEVAASAIIAALWSPALGIQIVASLRMLRREKLGSSIWSNGLRTGVALLGFSVACAVLSRCLLTEMSVRSPIIIAFRLAGLSVVVYMTCRLVTLGPIVADTMITLRHAVPVAWVQTQNKTLRVLRLLIYVGLPLAVLQLTLHGHRIGQLIVAAGSAPILLFMIGRVYLASLKRNLRH